LKHLDLIVARRRSERGGAKAEVKNPSFCIVISRARRQDAECFIL